jgi:hypothetical protein
MSNPTGRRPKSLGPWICATDDRTPETFPLCCPLGDANSVFIVANQLYGPNQLKFSVVFGCASGVGNGKPQHE